jgi:hypothetical protein
LLGIMADPVNEQVGEGGEEDENEEVSHGNDCKPELENTISCAGDG